MDRLNFSGENLDPRQQKTRDYVIILNRASGSMRATYFMVDPRTNKILPKASVVKWPRLNDWIDFRACVLKNTLYIIGGREKSSGRFVNFP